jgi:hypothetical protein
MTNENQFDLMQFDEFDFLMQNVNSQSFIDGLNILDDSVKNVNFLLLDDSSCC